VEVVVVAPVQLRPADVVARKHANGQANRPSGNSDFSFRQSVFAPFIGEYPPIHPRPGSMAVSPQSSSRL
jgi:hypothetical protein